MLKSSGLDEESKRHDKAVEQLQAAQAEWSRKQTERLNWISEYLRRQGHAVQTFRDVDDAIREYWRVTKDDLTFWDLTPSSPTIICQAVGKKTVKSPSLSSEWPLPA